MNRKLVQVRLYGVKRGQLWWNGEGCKEFSCTFIPGGQVQFSDWYAWTGLQNALKVIYTDDDFQPGSVILDDIWGEAIYRDRRGVLVVPMEIATATLKRFGFWRDYTD